MESPFEQRLTDCQSRLEDGPAQLAVCAPGSNLTYLTGFDESPSERHLLLFIPHASADASPTFVAPTMYNSQLEDLPLSRLKLRLWDDNDDPLEAISRTLESFDLDLEGDGQPAILVDDRMWATFMQDLQSLCPAAEFGLASDVLEGLRIRKDEAELATLARAGELADRVSMEIRSRGEQLCGLTERELAAEIDRLLAEYGGHEPAFETIVASGPNSARPHHHSGDRTIQRGDPLVLDFGAFVDSDLAGDTQYPGDQTRTMVVGDPPEGYETIHELVAEPNRPPSTPSNPASRPARSTQSHASTSPMRTTATHSSTEPATASASRSTNHRTSSRTTTANSRLAWSSASSRESISRIALGFESRIWSQ